ncbi:MerR family transcriptional regulator [Microbacterium sp. CFH 90308]|uniref:MerR family transcriptional regulator n=2 Tax=Microbacterium salsuginis TaxID=2722803 RepID=A0ABX1K617_9MICO|nr:MerR family transcriptional regulator [Microbacterium sp. CFH 90308]NLP82442.1 MerR family transcriptional regulator [Microbacterium sp. CFH 90308]
MYTIGEFAAIGRVSVRMLRHYDAIGILPPADVDERTGYRYYADAQLADLLRLVELRDLGCGLDEIGAVLSAADRSSAMREVLVRRRAQIETSIADDRDRLARIDERLHILEGATPMSTVEYRPIGAVTVYAVEGRAPGMGPENVSPAIDPLIERLTGAIGAAGREPREPGVFWYEAVPDSEELAVHVSFTADPEPVPGEGYDVVDLPPIATAAVLTHRGDMPSIGRSWMALMDQVVADGYRITGPTREVYLEAGPELSQDQWVTELIAPVARD